MAKKATEKKVVRKRASKAKKAEGLKEGFKSAFSKKGLGLYAGFALLNLAVQAAAFLTMYLVY